MIDLKQGGKTYQSNSFSGLTLACREIGVNEFDGCTFIDCDFSDATFNKCSVIECRFSRCNLSVAKVCYSQFSDVVFDHCKLIVIDWTGAAWPNIALNASIGFNHCILHDSSFFGLHLEQILIERCQAQDVDFREAELSKTVFIDTVLSNRWFNNSNLNGADFTGATGYRIDITTNAIKGAIFSRFEVVSLLDRLAIGRVD